MRVVSSCFALIDRRFTERLSHKDVLDGIGLGLSLWLIVGPLSGRGLGRTLLHFDSQRVGGHSVAVDRDGGRGYGDGAFLLSQKDIGVDGRTGAGGLAVVARKAGAGADAGAHQQVQAVDVGQMQVGRRGVGVERIRHLKARSLLHHRRCRGNELDLVGTHRRCRGDQKY